MDDLLREEDRLLTQRFTAGAVSGVANAALASQASGSIAVNPQGVNTSGNQQTQGQASVAITGQTASGAVQVVRYVIANPEAGVLLVRATSRLHERVQEYLDQILPRVKRQVLIEATIAEVQLNNQFQRGIDWSLLRSGRAGLNTTQGIVGPSGVAGVNTSFIVMNYASQGIGVTLRLLESFGNVRVLSSPKISVLNNQTAVLKVVDDRVYFNVTANTNQVANAGISTTFTTTPQVVSVGLVMNVTPQISEEGSVLLNVRPSVSRILNFVNDPNPSLAAAGVVNRIPEIQTREIESMIRMQNGQIAVMGGLIQDSNSDNQDGVPGLGRLPGIGLAFSNRNQANTKTELVVFLRPIVVNDPSMEGDFKEMRSLVPDAGFIGRVNPGLSQESATKP